ncbi:MAG: Fur family transcriptional regulator [Myxococcota bacterium]
MDSPTRIEKICIERGLRMTDQRRVIARVVSSSDDHPDVDTVYRRSNDLDSRISIATVYRTLRLFEDAGILQRHDFGDGRARYEELVDREHHDHLIDLETGEVVEFHDEELETLKRLVAERLGYDLVDHRLELYGVPVKKAKASNE